MDRVHLLQTVAELDDPAEGCRLLAEALLGVGSPGEDPLDAELVRRLGVQQIELGYEARGLQLLDVAASWAPDWLTLFSRRVALQDRGEDLCAVTKTRALLPVSPKAAKTELFHLYQDLGFPALALDARGGGIFGFTNARRLQLWLWCTTGGPLWFVRAAMRRRETAQVEASLGGDDETVSVVPLLRAVLADSDRDRTAWNLLRQADRLAADSNVPAAARLLVEPISSPDVHPRLLREAVLLARRLGDSRLALQLGTRLGPGFGSHAPLRAELLLDLDRLRDAWTLLENGGVEEEFRDVRAKILLTAGLSFLAVDVRGEVGFGRTEWRRRWWRTGGPLWFLRARGRRRDQRNLMAWLGPAQGAFEEPEPVALAAALGRAADVGDAVAKASGQRSADAVAILAAVHDPDRPSVPLLDQLAWALYLDDQEELALRRIREARALEPVMASLLDAELTFLKYLDRYVEALNIADRYAEADGRPSEARSSCGDLLDDLGFFALSLDMFGPAEGLNGWGQALRRKQWWRTGGPLQFLRGRLRRSDEATLGSWRTRADTVARILGSVIGPDQVTGLRFVSDRFTFVEARRRLRWQRVNVVARLTAGYAGSVIAGVALASLAGDLTLLWSASVGVVGAVIVFGSLQRVYRFTRAEPGDQILTRVLPAIAAVGAAGYLITRVDGPWPLLIGATVVATAAVTMLRLIAAAGARIAERLSLRRIARIDPRGSALVGLLDVLADLRRPHVRNDLGWRRQRLQMLEQVALKLETDLPAIFAADRTSADLLRRRGRGAAAAVRELKYLLVAAPPGAWRRIETVLHKDVAALATGSLGRLQTIDPPAPQTIRRSWRQVVADVARTLFFAGLPLGVVLVAQPWLRFNETILNWARLLTIGWALLYVLLTADPTFRDKLRTGFALINLGQGTGDPAQLDAQGSEKRPGPTK